ncbi:hypothetical protein [Streptomyces beihaiensis]|uniref:Uncharacterized protein n=1 Tax=Streptomyces beihaiensis TaxID=2984495 RepID=A0ABT3U4H2_9ACTN|nr:hypothetical protein [Streptomyces beihaiensis]MCX3064184.1 hypothetical protein [Streptomyces beihaiensis]
MRPAAFRDYLVDLLKNAADVQSVDFLDDGKHPFAIAVTAAGREQRWQLIGQLAEGAKHDTPTAPVEGQPAPFQPAPVGGAPDAWLAGVVGAAESPQIERIEVWSTRGGGDSTGFTVAFHNGEQVFVRPI